MVVTRYRTVARAATAEVEVKRSRFLARVEPVPDEETARAVVEAARKRHWDARHHCSAFVLGPDGSVQRSSDDGEPAGTAGAPMLEVLRGAPVSDTVAVVTRWFGGTLLGAGGLVRAYGDAVRAALAEAGTRERRLVEEWELVLDHIEAGRVESELRGRGVTVLGADWSGQATLRLGVPPEEATAFLTLVAELTAGTGAPTRVGARWLG